MPTHDVLLWYNKRGEVENYIKEVKAEFGMEMMPCGKSYANAVFFRIGVVAYNLFTGFKKIAFPESWKKHSIRTIRWKLINIAGKIVKHARQLILKVYEDKNLLRTFEDIRMKIYAFKENFV